MAQSDLVQLPALKAWLNITTVDANRDAQLSTLITQISRAILNNINREAVLPTILTDNYHGNGHNRIQLWNWPVNSISSLTINGESIPASTAWNVPGYSLDAAEDPPPGAMQILNLINYRFWKGINNVTVQYVAGYLISGEQQTVPSTGPYQVTVSQPYGVWGSDYGVTYASGAALTSVAPGTIPSVGQYSVYNGVYTLSAADAGASLIISYGYIPADLTQCAMEWAAYRYAAKDRIGQTSKSLGGQETTSYTNEAIPVFVQETLQNFRRII